MGQEKQQAAASLAERHDRSGSENHALVAELIGNTGTEGFPEYVARLFSGPLDSANVMHEAEEAIAIQNKLLPATIAVTKPQDWIAMGGGDNAKLYFQGVGGERVNAIWGMIYGLPIVELERFPDDTYAYIVRGGCASARTRVIYSEIIGGRWSGEGFFRKTKVDPLTGEEVVLPVNPMDVRKAAHTNWLINCVSRVAGLRGLTVRDLLKVGYARAGEIEGIHFNTGAKGGKGGGTGAYRTPAKFGSTAWRDKPVTEVPEAGLKWYIAKCQETIADPEKKQFHSREQTFLNALNAELESRATATVEAKESEA